MYYELCVLIKDIGRRLPLQLQCSYQGQQGDVSQSVRPILAHVGNNFLERFSRLFSRISKFLRTKRPNLVPYLPSTHSSDGLAPQHTPPTSQTVGNDVSVGRRYAMALQKSFFSPLPALSFPWERQNTAIFTPTVFFVGRSAGRFKHQPA